MIEKLKSSYAEAVDLSTSSNPIEWAVGQYSLAVFNAAQGTHTHPPSPYLPIDAWPSSNDVDMTFEYSSHIFGPDSSHTLFTTRYEQFKKDVDKLFEEGASQPQVFSDETSGGAQGYTVCFVPPTRDRISVAHCTGGTCSPQPDLVVLEAGASGG